MVAAAQRTEAHAIQDRRDHGGPRRAADEDPLLAGEAPRHREALGVIHGLGGVEHQSVKMDGGLLDPMPSTG